jgi:LIVCS family branched-chain amino acid:cation transporter
MPAVVRAKRSGDVSPDPSRKPPQLFDFLLVVFPFMTRLKGSDLLALGFMTFALFLGAGNIIFPPSAGLAAGGNLLPAALGFLLTGVGLPLLTVVALARVGGGMDRLTAPLGKVAGAILAVAVYLAIGPLFATPRTAVVSFEMGIAPFTGNEGAPLLIYTLVYFVAVLFLSLNPGQLVDRIGKFITPVLLAALLVLGGAALFAPAGEIGVVAESYREAPLVQGFLQGYLTMDTLGALVFGIVIASAIRDRGVSDAGLVTRYSIIAGVIAAIGLSLVYLALFYLGATSQGIAGDAQNGVQVLTTYVQHTFGTPGSLLLAVVITLACLTTAVGLLTACGEFFSKLLPVSYRTVVIVFGLFSLVVANQGLTQLISFSIPVLVGLYPLAIVLVALSLADRLWVSQALVFVPVMAVTLVFGVADGVAATPWADKVPAWFGQLPLAGQSLGWLLPVAVTLVLVVALDRLLGLRQSATTA